MENVIVLFIPLLSILSTGIVIALFLYLRSRERMMLIERGIGTDEIKLLYQHKSQGTLMLKTGIVIFFFGLGLGLGFMMENLTSVDEWMPFLIISFIGIGFIAAFFYGKKHEEKQPNGTSD